MKFNKFFKEFEVNLDDSKIIPMLVFIEYRFGRAVVHMMIWPEGVGSVDNRLSGSEADMEKVFEKMDQKAAQIYFDEFMRPMLVGVVD